MTMNDQSSAGSPCRVRMGHYAGVDKGLTAYSTQPLPNRPARGKETHPIVCLTCGQMIEVTIMDEQMRNSWKVFKLFSGLAMALLGVIMGVQTASTPSDPQTYEQPGYVVWAVFGWTAVVIVGICVFALGFHETGVRLRAAKGNWVARLPFTPGHRAI